MLGEPGLLPDGINSWTPDARMRSMMSPTLIENQVYQTEMVLGTGGAVRIPFVLAQMLLNFYQYQMPLEKAVQQPRMYFDGKELHVEAADDVTINLNVPVRRWRDLSMYFGGVNAIASQDKSLIAVGDQRRFGETLRYTE